VTARRDLGWLAAFAGLGAWRLFKIDA